MKPILPPPNFEKGEIVYFNDDEDDWGLVTAKIKDVHLVYRPYQHYVYEVDVIDPPDIELSYNYIDEHLLSKTKPKFGDFYTLEWKK
jgi:hypothetical protein